MKNKRGMLILLWLICAGLWIFLSAQFYNEKDNHYFALTDLSENILIADTVNLSLTQHSLDNCVNVNEADQTDLQKLPGIGPVLAKNIIDYRQNFGKFEKGDDLINVKGIGRVKLFKIQEFTCF
ncbi:MAG: helix-hairpin-helix domain-containing protein [Fibrobacter sp.]|nr:helix-hairpin-helix domain-containing protein [Fibrobacter sp.]